MRIRGKLGQLSRTELVGRVLRHEIVLRTAQLQAENARLMAEAQIQAERMEGLVASMAVLKASPWHYFALASLPDAAFVTSAPATVVYANRRALRLYGAGPEGLEGLAMRDLTTAETPERLREPCREMLQPGGPETETHGIEEPYYALRRDGSNFRAVVKAERFDTSAGPFVALTVREFMEDADAALRTLREPLRAS